jgi:hypothetical protein
MHCRNCGHDLRGLDASGRCSECGLDVWSTVIHTVDPAASRLPSVRNPLAVGNSLVVLTACMFAGALLMCVPSIVMAVEDADLYDGGRSWWNRLPGLHWQSALVLIIAGGWAVWNLAPPRGSEPHGPVWDDIWRLAVGYVGWIACAAMLAGVLGLQTSGSRSARIVLGLAAGAFALIGMFGLRGVFRLIGQRSREYRRMKAHRQSVDLMMLAVAGAMLGNLIDHASHATWLAAPWRLTVHTIGSALLAMSMFMLVVGLAYLVANAWWIRQALLRPPPALDEVLLPRMPNDTWLPDRED